VIGPGREGEKPRWLRYVYMMVADADGGPDIAVVICGSVPGPREKLYILDADTLYFRPRAVRRACRPSQGHSVQMACHERHSFSPRAWEPSDQKVG
jgi:hypothetical protein